MYAFGALLQAVPATIPAVGLTFDPMLPRAFAVFAVAALIGVGLSLAKRAQRTEKRTVSRASGTRPAHAAA